MENSITLEVSKDVCIILELSLDIKSEDSLISLQTLNSWNTLLNAAKIRNHASILDLAGYMTSKEIPRVYYHRKCMIVFALKRDLVALRRKAVSNPSDDAVAICSAKRQPRIKVMFKITHLWTRLHIPTKDKMLQEHINPWKGEQCCWSESRWNTSRLYSTITSWAFPQQGQNIAIDRKGAWKVGENCTQNSRPRDLRAIHKSRNSTRPD